MITKQAKRAEANSRTTIPLDVTKFYDRCKKIPKESICMFMPNHKNLDQEMTGL